MTTGRINQVFRRSTSSARLDRRANLTGEPDRSPSPRSRALSSRAVHRPSPIYAGEALRTRRQFKRDEYPFTWSPSSLILLGTFDRFLVSKRPFDYRRRASAYAILSGGLRPGLETPRTAVFRPFG